MDMTWKIIHLAYCECFFYGLLSNSYHARRSPKHRIVPSVLLSGSINAAFDDICAEDPDFGFIQGKLDPNDLMLFI